MLEERGDMRGIVVVSVAIGFLFSGCVADRSLKKEQEKAPVRPEISQGQEQTLGKVRSLEVSLAVLRGEVDDLKRRLASLQVRPPITAYRLPKGVSICGERVPVEDRKVWENLDREFLVALGNEPQVLLWMKRARRYFPHIEKRLKEAFLPDDLKYVTITESSLRPYAVSYAGAAGIWQFIPSTGERYGMRWDGGIDERFDFFKATEGALAYVNELYQEFKSWPLVLAAYNAGENRIRREIAFQGIADYVYLDLPMETERYVYKIIVAKIILSHPEAYGFRLDEGDYYEPLQGDRVEIELYVPLPIRDVAAALGSYYKEMKEMNLHLSEEIIPVGTHVLNLPPGTSRRFWEFFSRWQSEAYGGGGKRSQGGR
jgi:membrane-bound lytic murein transglycosylase D